MNPSLPTLVAMSCGNSENIAFYNSVALVRTGLLGGEHLPSLLKEADFHLEAMHKFHNTITVPITSAYRETISILTDKGEHTSKKSYEVDTSNTMYAHRYNEELWLNEQNAPSILACSCYKVSSFCDKSSGQETWYKQSQSIGSIILCHTKFIPGH